MGILNYQDNHGKVEDWDLVKLKTAQSITKYMFYVNIALACGLLMINYFNFFDAKKDSKDVLIFLLIITLLSTLLLGIYTLGLHLYIKYFRRPKRK